MMTKYNNAVNYEWLNNLKNWTLLSTKDVRDLFNYKNVSSVNTAILRNQFPKPKKIIISNGKQRNYWTVDTIREEIKRRKGLNNV